MMLAVVGLCLSLFALIMIYNRMTSTQSNKCVNLNSIHMLVYNRMSSISDSEKSHDMTHIYTVLSHAKKSIDSMPSISNENKLIIELACLLHDVDDKKYFTNSTFARDILKQYFPNLAKRVMACIKLVSTSDNGNEINPTIQSWQYIPRWADRLEAMGQRGIDRCVAYGARDATPLFAETTPKPRTQEELDALVTSERFLQYQQQKKSASIIDHFYDKLLHLKVHTGIPYIDAEMENQHQVMVSFVLKKCSSF